MKLEDQVVSLELAKKLKELGVSQKYKKGDFVWFQQSKNPDKWYLHQVTIHGSDHKCSLGICECECDVCFPHGNKDGIKAYTVAELGEMLPSQIGLYKSKKHYSCVDTNPHRTNRSPAIKEEKEADARAKMLIYLLENNLINN